MNNKVEKRKRKVVTIAQKLEVIKRLDEGDLLKNVEFLTITYVVNLL
jgi:hypothetical protein